jgi:hypothetical protein
MLAHQVLRKASLVTRHAIAAEVTAVLAALREIDAAAALLPLPEAWASRELAERLWNALPDESEGYAFSTVAEMTAAGQAMVAALPDEGVVLHLGWDSFAIRTTLRAAWDAWPRFCDVSIAAHNALVYPDSLRWYVVRAGACLYPMTCEHGETPVLRLLPSVSAEESPPSSP